MAVKVLIIDNTKFTVNGKTVYNNNGSWYSNPYLSTPEETITARNIIKDIKSGTLDLPFNEPQLITHV